MGHWVAAPPRSSSRLFGERVFHRGRSGIGSIWGFAGIGLLLGGASATWLGRGVDFSGYKRAVIISYIVHGGTYMLFSQYAAALIWR